MDTAPKDGTRVLLHYRVTPFDFRTYSFRVVGEKWEECRWVDDEKRTGSPPHWEPWCGTKRIHTTEHIHPDHAIGWRPLPSSET